MNINSKRMAALLLTLGMTAAACGTETEAIDQVQPAQAEESLAMADDAMEDEAMEDEAMADLPATVVDIATSSDDFSTLVAAVVEADLVDTLSGDGPFTVFAPTNAAFEQALADLGLTAEELLASDDLASILTYHVVPGKIMAADAIAADGTEVATVNGDTIEVNVVDGNVMIDGATVTTADLEAGNGVVHVIDSVILPGPHSEDAMEDDAMEEDAMEEDAMEEDAMEEEAMADLPATVVDIAMSSDDFSTLVAAVVEADLAETLSGEGPFTVFAPTNAAFEQALADLGLTAEELLASDDLASILTYHVVPAKVLAADAIAADGTEVPTVNGDTISVSVVDGKVMVDGATVITADLEAGNGVVHVIDSVILPG